LDQRSKVPRGRAEWPADCSRRGMRRSAPGAARSRCCTRCLRSSSPRGEPTANSPGITAEEGSRTRPCRRRGRRSCRCRCPAGAGQISPCRHHGGPPGAGSARGGVERRRRDWIRCRLRGGRLVPEHPGRAHRGQGRHRRGTPGHLHHQLRGQHQSDGPDPCRPGGDDVVVAVSRNTLECPAGPLAGRHQAYSTSVLTRAGDEGSWRIVSSHNTLVTG
jgi:hypothetical protein